MRVPRSGSIANPVVLVADAAEEAELPLYISTIRLKMLPNLVNESIRIVGKKQEYFSSKYLWKRKDPNPFL